MSKRRNSRARKSSSGTILLLIILAVGGCTVAMFSESHQRSSSPTNVPVDAQSFSSPTVTSAVADAPPTDYPTSTMVVITIAPPTDEPTFVPLIKTTSGGNSGSGSKGIATITSGGHPADALALCVDGSYWYGAAHRGACSGHKGVETFYK